MTKYDDRFAATVPADSVFVDKGALDPLAEPAEINARDAQERELATLLNGVHVSSLLLTVSLYGLPGTGKGCPSQAAPVAQPLWGRECKLRTDYLLI